MSAASVLFTAVLLSAAALHPTAAHAQARSHAVVVDGNGGTDEYRDAFHEQAMRLRSALVERHGIAEGDVVYLGETVDVAPEAIRDRATRENVLATLAGLAEEAGPDDRVMIVLFGHGTSGSSGASFNLPGPDITPTDLGAALDAFPSQSVALVHTGSGSGAFVAPAAGPNRVVITATRTERELNATEFGAYFVDALDGDGADMDRDGSVSLLEAYTFARQEVARHYEAENEILTENALLDDDGDGEGTYEASADAGDGALAARFRLGGTATAEVPRTDDPVLQRLYRERADIQRRVDELRAVRESIDEARYLEDMEALLVELALKNREIRAAGGGA